jgi:hypothetical protein
MLMLLVLIVGTWMGWMINQAESRRKAVAILKDNRAIVLYDYESMGGLRAPTARRWHQPGCEGDSGTTTLTA